MSEASGSVYVFVDDDFVGSATIDNGQWHLDWIWTDDNPSGTPSDTVTIEAVVSTLYGTATASTTLTINNLDPVVRIVPAGAAEGASAAVTFTIQDDGPDTFTLSIGWGDGTMQTLSQLGAGDHIVSHTYVDDNPTGTPQDSYDITASVVDDDTGTGSRTESILVSNLPPTADAGSNQTAFEGDLVTVSATATDPGSADTHTFAWQVSAGNGQVIPGGSGQSYAFTPSDEGDYIATVTATDDDTGFHLDGSTVIVANVAPTITTLALSSNSVFEGEVVTLTGALFDPGVNDSETITIDWGDGSQPTVVTTTGGSSSIPAAYHVYADDGESPGNGTPSDVHTITVTVDDGDGGFDDDSISLTVNNAPPSITFDLPSTAFEGGTALLTGTITDPGAGDLHSVLVDWGDGETSTHFLGPGAFAIQHTYLDDDPTGTSSDPYSIAATITDDDGGSNSACTVLTVENVAPTLSLDAPAAIDEGDTATLEGVLMDDGVNDTVTLQINWGDGAPIDTLTVSANGAFSAQHVYLDDKGSGTPSDNYTISVAATDDDGGIANDTATQTVNNVAPEVQIGPFDPVAVDAVFSLSGSFTDPGIHAATSYYPPETHTVEVDWGDGVVETLPSSAVSYQGGSGAFSATHIYTDIAPYTVKYHRVKVTVTDDDTGLGVAEDDSGAEGVPLPVYDDPDIDTDSNNDGQIDPDNTPAGTDDPIEENEPGGYVPVNDDDDDQNGVRDFDEVPVYASLGTENDLAKVRLDEHFWEIPDQSGWTLTLSSTDTDKIRVWRRDPDQPNDQMLELDLYGNAPWDVKSLLLPDEVWVEGLAAGAASLSWLLQYEGAEVRRDTVVFELVQIDLDVDSDNNNGLELSAAEDAVEDKAGEPGKLIRANRNLDSDADWVPDFADGFNLEADPDKPEDDDELNMTFTPLKLTANGNYDLDIAKLRISYSASNPRDVDTTNGYTPASGLIRIWKPGWILTRDSRDVNDPLIPGDYVAPDIYAPAKLGLSNDDRSIDLLIEGINHGSAQIAVEVDPDGNGPEGFIHFDTVRVGIVLVDLDVTLDLDADDPSDGVWKYLPGYSGDNAVLSVGNSYNTAGLAMQLTSVIAQGVGTERGVTSAEFVILDTVTEKPGYAENKSDPAIEVSGKDDDFSFGASVDLRQKAGTVTSDKSYVPLWVKDYGGEATVRVTLKKNQTTVFTADLDVPLDADNDHLADHWERLKHAELEALYGPSIFPGVPGVSDFEPRDSDGGGDMPEHKESGDNITADKEYRGYILDGGHGQFAGGHRRLSPTFKEFLVEVDRSANVWHMPSIEELIEILNDMASGFEHPLNGAGIHVYWVLDEHEADGQVFLTAEDMTDWGSAHANDDLTDFGHLMFIPQLLNHNALGSTDFRHSFIYVDQCWNSHVVDGWEFHPLLATTAAHELTHQLLKPMGQDGFSVPEEHLANPDVSDVANGPNDLKYLMYRVVNDENAESITFSAPTRRQLNLKHKDW